MKRILSIVLIALAAVTVGTKQHCIAQTTRTIAITLRIDLFIILPPRPIISSILYSIPESIVNVQCPEYKSRNNL